MPNATSAVEDRGKEGGQQQQQGPTQGQQGGGANTGPSGASSGQQNGGQGVAVRPRSLYTAFQGQFESRRHNVARILETQVGQWLPPQTHNDLDDQLQDFGLQDLSINDFPEEVDANSNIAVTESNSSVDVVPSDESFQSSGGSVMNPSLYHVQHRHDNGLYIPPMHQSHHITVNDEDEPMPMYISPGHQSTVVGSGRVGRSSAVQRSGRRGARSSRGRQPGMPPGLSSFYPGLPDEMAHYDMWREHSDPNLALGATATPHGTIALRLRDRVRVELTCDQSVRVCNTKNNTVLSLSADGSSAAMVHPNGRVWQYGSRVEIMTHDPRRNHKYAKMWYKGVSFTSERCALVYLVDSAGTRTTTDSFSNLKQDVSVPVFLGNARHGPAMVSECVSQLQMAQFWIGDDGSDNWLVNGLRVSQTRDGLVRVGRNNNKYQMRTSPSNGTASVTTPFLHCTASLGQTSHLFVKRGERRMHYDGSSFIVRNAGHSAGFDERNQLKVY